ncbi:MAG: gamma carbonic anhydrase family protein [Bdellovibrionales bacterium]|nr:gamma carbonic anhydrase family protein [Bdellovibrionales bacterium]
MHKPIILPFEGKTPKIHPSALIMPGAVVIGDVEIGEGSNIWPGVVIRGDINYIRIGKRTNIQDGTVVHVTRPAFSKNQKGMTLIGDDITIGHKALLHACTLEDGSFVGMGAIVIDGATVQTGAMVAAGALVTYNKVIPTGEIWAGNPATFLRKMKEEEKAYIPKSAQHYVEDAKMYINQLHSN